MTLIVIALALLLACLPARATTYYVSPVGNDLTGDGSLKEPWASCHHDVKAGDYILWLDGTYRFSTNNTPRHVLGSGQAHCWAKNFAKAIISSSESHGAFWIQNSNWDIEGFVVNSDADEHHKASCFRIQPIGPSNVLHTKIANNVCTGAYFGCVATVEDRQDNGSGADYLDVVQNICFDGAKSSGSIYTSGIDIDGVVNGDSVPGTHIYIARNLIYKNINTNEEKPHSDGEGIIMDRLDGSDTGLAHYKGQIVVEYNYVIANGGPGIKVWHSPDARIIIRNNWVWGNLTDPDYSSKTTAEITLARSSNVTTTRNFVSAGENKKCCSNNVPSAIWGYYDDFLGEGIAPNTESNNSFGSYPSQVCKVVGSSCSATDTLISHPAITVPIKLGRPNCAAYSSAQECIDGFLGPIAYLKSVR